MIMMTNYTQLTTINTHFHLINMDTKDTLTPEFCDLVDHIVESGLDAEVIASALLEMKSHPHASPLLCLQVAVNNWDI